MKRILYPLFFIIIAASVLVPVVAAGEYIPGITRPVNDYANIISPAEEERIARMIVDHRKKTGIQMAVLTVNTIGQTSIEEFSIKTAEKWGGGAKKRDDGLLFTVAPYDRRMRIEVGYGLEGYITDLKAGRILDGIRDDFKSYNYGRGIEKVVLEIIRATNEVRPGEEPPASVRLWGAFAHVIDWYIIFFIVGGIFAILLILGRMRKKLTVWVTVVAGLCLFIAIPVLFQFFLHGAWFWTPVLYLMGAFAGSSIMVAITVPVKKKSKKIAAVFMSIPVLTSMASIIYFLQILKPVKVGTSSNETIVLGILIGTNILQFCILAALGESSSGGSSYSSGSSGSSGSSSSSSSSNDTSWSGGGGSFGGGGASSSW